MQIDAGMTLTALGLSPEQQQQITGRLILGCFLVLPAKLALNL